MTASKSININDLRRQISAAVAEDRRSRDPLTAQIIPLDADGRGGRSRPVELEQVDKRGITFQHQLPLANRRATLVLEAGRLGRVTAELDLSWCRFSRRGQYSSGGRIVQLVGRTAS